MDDLIKNADFKIFYADERLVQDGSFLNIGNFITTSIDRSQEEEFMTFKATNADQSEESNAVKVGIIVGAEGGFSDQEFEMLKQHNPVGLGRNILRSDTALVNMLLIAKMLKKRL